MSDVAAPYIYTSKDTEIDFVADPANLVKALPHYTHVFDQLALERNKVDHFTTEVRYGEKRAGGKPGFKLLARMPEPVLTWLLVLEPDLLKNKATFRRFLKKHPEYAGYTGVKA